MKRRIVIVVAAVAASLLIAGTQGAPLLAAEQQSAEELAKAVPVSVPVSKVTGCRRGGCEGTGLDDRVKGSRNGFEEFAPPDQTNATGHRKMELYEAGMYRTNL
jgi:hypothetical protein